MDLLKKLLTYAETLPKEDELKEKELGKHLLIDSNSSFQNLTSQGAMLALQMGRIDMLEEIMRVAPFGIYISDLVGEEDEETARRKAAAHYPGLSVRGKREKEWVDSAAPRHSSTESDRSKKIAQVAALTANKQVMKWLRSERPWHCFQDYIQRNPNTPEVKILLENGDTLRNQFDKAIGLQTTLLPHILITGWYGEPSAEMLRLLIQEDPSLLNAKNDNLLTPALVAVHCKNAEAVKVLLELGADFSVRSKLGMNIIHMLLSSRPSVKVFKQWIELFPEEVVAKCWTERMSKVQRTPLAYYLELCIKGNMSPSMNMLEYILEKSGQRALDIANSEGNLPIHTVCFPSPFFQFRKILTNP